MGRERVEFTVSAVLGRHNSPEDDIDDQRWAELRRRVDALTDDYNDIQAEVDL